MKTRKLKNQNRKTKKIEQNLFKTIGGNNTMSKRRLNEELITLMDKLQTIMAKQGEPFKARAYKKAEETIMEFNVDIIDVEQLKGKPGIGETIMKKLVEYSETGTLRLLEREKNNPENILSDVYGIGPKKAKDLVAKGITSINQLRLQQDKLLNDVQKVGLKYYEDILERIPRAEIDRYAHIFDLIFNKVKVDGARYEIVGSYRRGATSSGDIDVIITSPKEEVFKRFIDQLVSEKVIVEILSRGPSKCLVIARLHSAKHARRVDFLFASPEEYPFSVLYFTGSKAFNTVMRGHALKMDFSLNEHGLSKMVDKKKEKKVEHVFRNEKDIFDYLNMEYKAPGERIDGRSVVIKAEPGKTRKIRAVIKKIPNEKIKIIDNNSFSEVEKMSQKELEDLVERANAAYYNETAILTDNEYDIVKELLERKYPNSTILKEVGAPVKKDKVTLPYEMASMDKIKPDTGALLQWTGKYKGPYVLSCKLDGVSGLYTTEGVEPKLYTRGNGLVGQDVSHLIKVLKLPKHKGTVVRGEFIIPKKVFEEKYKDKFANPRNLVAGIVNSKSIDEKTKDLHFVCYEVIMPLLKPSEQLQQLITLNYETVLNLTVDKLTNEYLSATLLDWRKDYEYEIDGVIVTNDLVYPRIPGNPEHAFAFKMVISDQIAEVKVLDVLWSPSKDGYLKPRVRIEPIRLGGVTIEYATGFNAKFIEENKIGFGAMIEIVRSGDVIPFIKSTIVPAERANMPNVAYRWTDSHVDIILENVANDPTVREKTVTAFFVGLEVDGLSTGNVKRLISAGFDTVPKIVHMQKADFKKVEGFKEKLTEKIYTSIHDKLEKAALVDIMAASGLLGRGLSNKKIEPIMTAFPDILKSTETPASKIKMLKSVKGIGKENAEAFVSNIEKFNSFYKEIFPGKSTESLQNVLRPVESTVIDKSSPLFGKKIVMTKVRDKDIIEYLKTVGATLEDSMKKDVFILIVKSHEDESSKTKAAKENNIPIMTPVEFKAKYI
uniref:DNA polymerase beta n=1 Tax=viral metagenome TaxID=1070528 RepID=A0A6C0B911_9ZZZZ